MCRGTVEVLVIRNPTLSGPPPLKWNQVSFEDLYEKKNRLDFSYI